MGIHLNKVLALFFLDDDFLILIVQQNFQLPSGGFQSQFVFSALAVAAVVLKENRGSMTGDNSFELVVLIYGTLQEFVRRLRHTADHIGLFDVSALEGQKHLVPHLRQKVVSPLAAAGRHDHPRPFQFVGPGVPGGNGDADPAVHGVRAGAGTACRGAVGVAVLRHDAHHHAEYPVVPHLRFCHLTLGNGVDHVVKSHGLPPRSRFSAGRYSP